MLSGKGASTTSSSHHSHARTYATITSQAERSHGDGGGAKSGPEQYSTFIVRQHDGTSVDPEAIYHFYYDDEGYEKVD